MRICFMYRSISAALKPKGGGSLSIRGISTSKALARWAGTTLAVVAGVVSFFVGMGGFFMARPKTGVEFLLIILFVLAMLSVLPLGVVAVFRPRTAAYGIATAWLAVVTAALASIRLSEVNAWALWWYLALPMGIVALLLYGSGGPAGGR